MPLGTMPLMRLMEINMDFFNEYADVFIAVVALLSSGALANLITMFIDESKVNKYFKPVVKVLNIIAGNIGKNRNATDV